MIKTGIIYNIDIDKRIMSLFEATRLRFYYISNGIMKRYGKYLYKGNLVSFVYDENSLNKKSGYLAYPILYFKEISVPGRYGKDVFYSKKDIKDELKVFLNGLDNLLFIDIEMSMPDYKNYKNFTNELIQAGFFICDRNYNIIEKYNYYVLPKINKFLTQRTIDFLNIDYEFLLDNGVEYIEFYNKFNEVLDKYNPAVIVFGKNDKSFLEKSYQTNNLPSLRDKTRFVNLNQLIKNFYDLPNDPGLVKTYERMYNIDHIDQAHNALEDAYYTYYVYKKFKEDVNK
ncbi:MAG: exonuclease domain-containing protein [Anaeroplasmataceae bacterium]